MSNFKETSFMLLRLVLAIGAMLFAYVVSTSIIGDTGAEMTQAQQDQAARGLVVVSLVSALLLSFLILRSRWRGLKLIVAVFTVQFGIETLMTQIESLYFNSALQMDSALLVSLVASGALRAAIFVPAATVILGKMRKTAAPDARETGVLRSDWLRRFVVLAVFYVVVYFLFGYFVAWQWAETRVFYTGSTEMKPFLTHMGDLVLREDPWLLPFQLLRGGIWTALAMLIANMIVARRWEASAAVALSVSLLMAMPLALFPNPYMPATVARSHFVELMTSMLLFGAVAGWAMFNPSRAASGLEHRSIRE